ncbi:MAG: glycosyltransferase family 2 protein [Planctomycetes bacterium]|nr:glycosyltransferase family 2 protein [Planctomycetota bacterium]
MKSIPPFARKRPPISASVICFNEEQNIGRCLESLSWCDEVVVVDSGSTDTTVSIARSFANTRVLFRPFDSHISQKNYALDQCVHEWVLSLDADEALTPELISEIQALAFDADGYFISRRTFLGEKEIRYGSWNPDYKLRLFRKSLGRWGGLNPHDKIILHGRTAYLKSRMLHYSYRSRDEFLERNERYVRLMADSMYQAGRRAHWWDAYLHWLGDFLKSYVWKAGVLDGSAGLFLAYHIANGAYRKYRLLSQLARKESGDNLVERGSAEGRDAA